MKIRKLTPENRFKAAALLHQAFSPSRYEEQLIENLHQHGRTVYEWVCIHTNTFVAYIAFTNAYRGGAICGVHLAPLAVKPQFQHQGIGSELLRFALRQEEIKDKTVFVLGDPRFYGRFGFTPCSRPVCPFTTKNAHFLALRNVATESFTVGYEPEFNIGSSTKRRSA